MANDAQESVVLTDVPEKMSGTAMGTSVEQDQALEALVAGLEKLQHVFGDKEVWIDLRLGDHTSKKVRLYRAKMKHMQPLVSFTARMLTDINAKARFTTDTKGGMVLRLQDMTTVTGLLDLVATKTEEVKNLVLLLSSLSADEYDDLDLDQGILLLGALVQLNKRFFMEQVMPLVRRLAPDLPMARSEKP